MNPNADKLKALQLTLDKLEKSYGKGAVMKLGDTPIEAIESISTGSISLDIALGIGGVQSLLVKLRWLRTLLPKHRKRVV
jgi:recombination protein RecA